MKKLLFIFLLCIIIILFSVSHSDSQCTTTQITNNSYEDTNPRTNDNNYVVWEGSDGSDFEIFLSFCAIQMVPRYRLYNPYSGHHHYTTDQNEYDILGNLGWIQEETICSIYGHIYRIDSVEAVPYFRLYNPNSYEHHWTGDANEYNVLGTIGWIQEGADGYVFPSRVQGSEPLYRLYNPNDGLHHWTMDSNERTVLIGRGFIDEGIAC